MIRIMEPRSNPMNQAHMKHGWRTAVHRDKRAKIILLTVLFPFLVYILGVASLEYSANGILQKTPYQFEALFYEKMTQYGMSIDIDSVYFSYGDGLSKTVPIKCEDGSKLSCTYYPTSERKKALIQYITYTQELTGVDGETIYIEQLLTFVLDEFETALTRNKDVSLDSRGVSYNEAICLCQEFINGEEGNARFFIAPKRGYGTAITLERKADEKTTISVRFHLWNPYRSEFV